MNIQATAGKTSAFARRLRNVMVSKICILLNIHERKQDGKYFIGLNSGNWLMNFQYSVQEYIEFFYRSNLPFIDRRDLMSMAGKAEELEFC